MTENFIRNNPRRRPRPREERSEAPAAERSEAPPSEARLHRAKRGSREGHREVAITKKLKTKGSTRKPREPLIFFKKK